MSTGVTCTQTRLRKASELYCSYLESEDDSESKVSPVRRAGTHEEAHTSHDTNCSGRSKRITKLHVVSSNASQEESRMEACVTHHVPTESWSNQGHSTIMMKKNRKLDVGVRQPSSCGPYRWPEGPSRPMSSLPRQIGAIALRMMQLDRGPLTYLRRPGPDESSPFPPSRSALQKPCSCGCSSSVVTAHELRHVSVGQAFVGRGVRKDSGEATVAGLSKCFTVGL
eukprot:7377554-Prymnesium_polylepis.2